jgi:hypothetical protein
LYSPAFNLKMAKKRSKSSKKARNPTGKRKVEIEFISMKSLEGKSTKGKINTILGKVKNRKLVVLNGALSTEEETELTKATMEDINDKFSGIQFCSLETKGGMVMNLLEFITGRRFRQGLTLVGDAKILKDIERHKDAFRASAEV